MRCVSAWYSRNVLMWSAGGWVQYTGSGLVPARIGAVQPGSRQSPAQTQPGCPGAQGAGAGRHKQGLEPSSSPCLGTDAKGPTEQGMQQERCKAHGQRAGPPVVRSSLKPSQTSVRAAAVRTIFCSVSASIGTEQGEHSVATPHQIAAPAVPKRAHPTCMAAEQAAHQQQQPAHQQQQPAHPPGSWSGSPSTR